MNELKKYFEMVEECISQLGVDPKSCRGQKEGQWSLVKGSAKVWIDIWYIEKEDRSYFQVMSPVLRIPDTNQFEFYKDLLEINDRLYSVAFSVYNGWAWLKTIRETENLDASEVLSTITRIGTYADRYDDELIAKYELKREDKDSLDPSTGGRAPEE